MNPFISYKNTSLLNPLIHDYLFESQKLKELFGRMPNLTSFKDQLFDKEKQYSKDKRKVLYDVLTQQYNQIESKNLTQKNIALLKNNNTFTVTTGHQLNLFTGPIYFIYKIISTLNLSICLNKKYPGYNFVPMYWMASEDHDFEEINHFFYQGKKWVWKSAQKGAVGEFNTQSLEKLGELLDRELGSSKNGLFLASLFKKAYTKNHSLSDATRILVHEIFKDTDLVILDANSSELKRLFIPIIKNEIESQITYTKVNETNAILLDISRKYPIQVHSREINLFYLTQENRERIIPNSLHFGTPTHPKKWTKDELFAEIESHPERFSPNALLRPVYQEFILPNLAYIGGAGELSYWLQLKSTFHAFEIPFPILMMRNAALLLNKAEQRRLKKLGLNPQDLFKPKEQLKESFVRKFSDIPIDFTPQREHLIKQFSHLKEIASQTDPSFIGAVLAQEKKQLNGLAKLEKRLVKAQKRKMHQKLSQIDSLYHWVYPNQKLQERQINFSDFYRIEGVQGISLFVEKLNPFENTGLGIIHTT